MMQILERQNRENRWDDFEETEEVCILELKKNMDIYTE